MTHLKYLSLLCATGVLLGCASGAPRSPAPVQEGGTIMDGSAAVEIPANPNTTRPTRRRPALIQDHSIGADDSLRDWSATDPNRPGTIKIQTPASHRVQRGDTLYSIGRKYNISPAEIADLNDLAPNAPLRAGQQLVLPLDDATAAPTPDVVVNTPRKTPVKIQPRATYSSAARTAPPVTTQPPQRTADPADEDIQWTMPAEGELIGGFSENGPQRGIEIMGDFGSPVVASAAGEVAYSGAGLRGYGKLILIKHNATYITAYAHNSKLLVKQGQQVAQGQQIAEMGNTDSNRVKLYFELRRFGKPVDPTKYLQLD